LPSNHQVVELIVLSHLEGAIVSCRVRGKLTEGQ